MISRPVSWNAGRPLARLNERGPLSSGRARLRRAGSSFNLTARRSLALPARTLATSSRFLSLCLSRSLSARSLRRALRSAKYASRQIAHGRALEFPRRPPRTFLSSVSAVAEQSRDRFSPAEKVHLKSVRLFLGARFGVDATDVLLRVGISSFFHWSCA